MNGLKKSTFILIFSIVFFSNLSAQQRDTTNYSNYSPSKIKFYSVVIGTTLSLTSSYIYVQNAWWTNNKKSFHFDNGPDYKYAKNIDKFGHLMGGLILAEGLHGSLKWAGLKDNDSYLYSFILGSTMHLFIEAKDGFAETYGFSIGDFVAGSIGGLIPYLKYKSDKFRSLNFKFSYYQRDRYYFEQFKNADWIDDYMNHTYWVTISPEVWLPKNSKVKKIWPDFLSFAMGIGVDNTLNWYYKGVNLAENKGKGNYEYYLSLDIDWREIIPQKTGGQRMLTQALNYIKIPLPTVSFGPQTNFHWFYF
jgi:hypothetical protein